MNILLMITKGEVGGAQMSTLNLARELKKRGHNILVGLGEGDFLTQELDQFSIPYQRFKYLKRTHNPIINQLFAHEFKLFLRKHVFDVIHFNSVNALFGARVTKKISPRTKIVFTLRGLSLLDENYESNAILKKIYISSFKTLYKHVDEAVFVSQKNLDTAVSMGLIKNGKVVYNGLDEKHLHFKTKSSARHELNKILKIDLNKHYVLGSLGRLAYQKNYEFLISTMPKILDIEPKAILILIGDGPEKEKYIALAEKMGVQDKIFFAGNIPLGHSFAKAFDLFVLPSRYEGFSITMLEALFAGMPMLASNVGGNAEMLENSEYQLYELDNQGQFIHKFQILAKDQDIYRQICSTNLRLSEKYTLEQTVDKYLEIY